MKNFTLLGIIVLASIMSGCKDGQDDSNVNEPETPSVFENSDSSSLDTMEIKNSNKDQMATDGANGNNKNIEANQTTERKNVKSEKTETPKVASQTYKAGVLTGSSINLIATSGKQESLRFGQSGDAVISKMTQYLGLSSSNEVKNDCNGKSVRIISWDEHITLLLAQNAGTMQFAGWSLQSRDENANKFKTTSGLTVGVTRASINLSNAESLQKTSLGYLYEAESVNAIFSADEDDAAITYLFAGVNCYDIEKGKKPEGEKN